MQTRTSYPYFKLFASAFCLDTEGMTAEEIGAYIMLLCRAWMSEPVGVISAKDPETLARYARVTPERWKKIKANVLRNFKAERTMLVSKVLADQWTDCEKLSETQRKKVNKRYRRTDGSVEQAANATSATAFEGETHVTE